MDKILGIVSVYHVEEESLVRNINTYLPYIDKLIIWKNSVLDNSFINRNITSNYTNEIEFWGNSENQGLALPFNLAAEYAKKNDYEYLLTMDQDSYFNDDMFKKYIQQVKKYRSERTGVFSPNINNRSTNDDECIQARTVISSGAIFPVKVFDQVGLFNERFFVYMIDIEFCFRLTKRHLSINKITNAIMTHQEGYNSQNSIGLKLNNYSAQSTYYIIRNTILTWKLHPSMTTNDDKKGLYKYKIIYRILKLPFEHHPFLKLKAITLGIIHGFSNKGGKYIIS